MFLLGKGCRVPSCDKQLFFNENNLKETQSAKENKQKTNK